MSEPHHPHHFYSPKKIAHYATLPSQWTHEFVARRRHCSWFLPAVLVFYAFVKDAKVGDPYLFRYQTQYLNLSREQITGEIYPYYPYAYLLSLIPIFLLTDLLLYKPTMLTEVLGQLGFRSALFFGRSVGSQVAGMFSHGVASASEVAFFSYIYARLDKHQYRRITSWTRAGTMAGRTSSYLFAQLFIGAGLGSLRQLFLIALAMPSLVLCLCLALPRVHWKVMAARMIEGRKPSHRGRPVPASYGSYVIYRVRKLRSDFVKIYQVGFIRKWSAWWALTTCMSLQVALFAQTMWGEVSKGNPSAGQLNGFTEAAYTFTSTCAILAMNFAPINWDKWGEVALVLISTLDAGMLLAYAKTDSIWVMYACYVGYRSLYQVMITIAQWNIAKKMVCESYGLVFGTNTFVALLLQSALTAIVTDKRGLDLPIRTQYLIYACLHLAIAVVFTISVLWNLLAGASRGQVQEEKPTAVGTKRRSSTVAIERLASVKKMQSLGSRARKVSILEDEEPPATNESNESLPHPPVDFYLDDVIEDDEEEPQERFSTPIKTISELIAAEGTYLSHTPSLNDSSVVRSFHAEVPGMESCQRVPSNTSVGDGSRSEGSTLEDSDGTSIEESRSSRQSSETTIDERVEKLAEAVDIV